MRGKSIYAAIHGRIKTLREWADEYDLPYDLVYRRWYNGWEEDDLLEPEPEDRLTPKAVRELWGRWRFRGNVYIPTRRWNRKQRWVYVG